MGKFIVMDIVFYAGSLNYDQGSGNYQELKKITKWDGKQYTFVSRYALRYSILNNPIFKGKVAPGTIFTTEKKGGTKGKSTLQPKPDSLFNGEILNYPEFDLFGYLITNTDPNNFRESPVKLSHAVSLTPFNYDTHMSGNHWIARRALEKGEIEKMDINLFTKEEHETFYIYSVVVDVDRVGSFTIYSNKKNDIEKLKKNVTSDIKLTVTELGKVYEVKLEVPEEEKRNRIKMLLTAILSLNREIKGEPKSLEPKLLILGLYENEPYKTFKDKIMLKDEYTEEEYDEIIEKPEGDGKITRSVVHKVTKSKKPVFEVLGVDKTPENLSNENVIKKIEEFLINGGEKGVYIYKSPEIEIRISNKVSSGSSTGA